MRISSSPSATICDTTMAAWPSSAGCGGLTATTPSGGDAASCSWMPAIAARSASLRAPSREKIAMAATPSADGNPSDSSSARTDSASSGRKLDGSFFCFDSNEPINGPSATSATSQAASTTNFERRPETRRAKADIALH